MLFLSRSRSRDEEKGMVGGDVRAEDTGHKTIVKIGDSHRQAADVQYIRRDSRAWGSLWIQKHRGCVGNVTEVALIDGNGSRTQWAYDTMGRLTSKTYADGSTYEYGYDDEGRLASRTDGKGVTTAYAYDALGRLVTIDYPTDPDVTTVYDALGRKTSVTDATGTWAYAYDGVSSRVVTVTDPDGNVLRFSRD